MAMQFDDNPFNVYGCYYTNACYTMIVLPPYVYWLIILVPQNNYPTHNKYILKYKELT